MIDLMAEKIIVAYLTNKGGCRASDQSLEVIQALAIRLGVKFRGRRKKEVAREVQAILEDMRGR